MRYICTLLAGGTLLASSVAGAQESKIALEVIATPASFAAMHEELARQFMESHPGIVINLDTSSPNPDVAVQGIIRRAVVDDVPDIAVISANHVRTLSDRGIAISLDSFIKAEADWADNYSESVTRVGDFKGEPHALGVGLSFPVLYYNSDLIAESLVAGETFPNTWEGLLESLESVAEAHPEITPGYHRFHPWLFQAHVNSRAFGLMNEDETEITFSKPGLEALQIVARFGELGQRSVSMTEDQARQSFAAGRIAVMTDASSGIKARKELIGESFELGVAPWLIPAEDGTVPAAGIAGMILSDDKARQEAAWEYLKFISGTEGAKVVAEHTGYVPANGKALEISAELGETLRADPLISKVLELVPRVAGWYIFPGENGLRIDDEVRRAVEEVATLKVTPEEAITTLEGRVRELLDQ